MFTNVTVTWCVFVFSLQYEPNYDAAIHKVRTSDGKFAALLDSWYAAYVINKPVCELSMIGQFNKMDACLGVTKGGPWKDLIGNALSELKKKGEFESIRSRWWPKHCTGASVSHRATLVMFVAIFVILELSMSSLY